MSEFLEKEIKAFEITEGHEDEINAEKINSRQQCWVGTWNNPTMTDEEFLFFLRNLENQELLQYAIFQREKGERCGTIHFQFFLNFKNKQYFSKLKNEILPKGVHFAPMKSNAERCKAYCSKIETRVSGPYEVGEFESKGKRTDLQDAITMLQEGVPFEVVRKIYKTQCVMYERQLRSVVNTSKEEEFSNKCRNIEVTYIYGSGGKGKTTRVYKKHGFKDVFCVDTYEKYLFEGYNYQSVVLFDEYNSQIKITEFNKLLDIFPTTLRGLGKKYQACYEKVYIVSNFSLSEQYKNLSEDERKSLKPFNRRIHNIIFVDDNGQEHIERQTIWEDVSEDEQLLPGQTRVAKQVIEYDKYGRYKIIYDKYKTSQMEIQALPAIAQAEVPFDD